MKEFFSLLFLIVSWSGLAQVVTVSESIVLREDVGYHIIGEQKGHVLLFRDMNTTYQVQAFDQNLRLSWDKEIKLDKYRPEVLDVIPNEEGFFVLYRFKEGGNYKLKLHLYDPAANLADSMTIKNLGSPFFIPKYDVILSEDKRKVLLVDFEKMSRVNALMLDLNTKSLLWEYSFEPDEFFPARDLREILADNKGNFYMILEKENRRTKKEDHHLEVFMYGPNHPGITQVQLPIPQFLTFDVEFDYDNVNQQLIAGGLYVLDNLTRAEGYYYLRSTLRSQDFVLEYHPFKSEFVSALLGKQVDENRGIPEIQIRNIALRMDGGILLFSERTKIYERNAAAITRSSFDRFSRFTVDYYYDDLFVSSVHPDGTIHWENVLHKKQYSQDDGAIFSSYFLLKAPSNLRLLFNDEIKNENTISEYILSPNGNFERKSVFSTENQELKLRFRDAIQIASNEIIVPSERRNRLKLVRVTF